jgi:hypothetical protein
MKYKGGRGSYHAGGRSNVGFETAQTNVDTAEFAVDLHEDIGGKAFVFPFSLNVRANEALGWHSVHVAETLEGGVEEACFGGNDNDKQADLATGAGVQVWHDLGAHAIEQAIGVTTRVDEDLFEVVAEEDTLVAAGVDESTGKAIDGFDVPGVATVRNNNSPLLDVGTLRGLVRWK